MLCNILSHDGKMFAQHSLVAGSTNLRSAQNASPKVHYLGDWGTIFLCGSVFPHLNRTMNMIRNIKWLTLQINWLIFNITVSLTRRVSNQNLDTEIRFIRILIQVFKSQSVLFFYLFIIMTEQTNQSIYCTVTKISLFYIV